MSVALFQRTSPRHLRAPSHKAFCPRHSAQAAFERLTLALYAEHRGSPTLAKVSQRCATGATGLPASAINAELLREITRRSVSADKISQRGASQLNSLTEYSLNRGRKHVVTCLCNAACGPRGVNARQKQASLA